MTYSHEDIVRLLRSEGEDMDQLFLLAKALKEKTIGDFIYLRGLIEYGNVCRKDCYYCGIRKSQKIDRYTLSKGQVLEAAEFAYKSGYGSVVIQGGEVTAECQTAEIETIVSEIKLLSHNSLGITLSLGEQSAETYRRWFEAGAHRYLLRIETSNPDIYAKLHPQDGGHTHHERVRALNDLKSIGYQVGTGVMIGLPFQTVEDLADDLLFMKQFDIDMCGMGPYIVSDSTPLAQYPELLMPEIWRLNMSLKMIATLRLLMPDINIAASTALQAIDPNGRLRGVECGANVIMPNISPQNVKANYMLYNNKPLFFDSSVVETKVKWGEWGDSQHFVKK